MVPLAGRPAGLCQTSARGLPGGALTVAETLPVVSASVLPIHGASSTRIVGYWSKYRFTWDADISTTSAAHPAAPARPGQRIGGQRKPASTTPKMPTPIHEVTSSGS